MSHSERFWQSSSSRYFLPTIPRGLRPPARGCDVFGATPGSVPFLFYPNGVASPRVAEPGGEVFVTELAHDLEAPIRMAEHEVGVADPVEEAGLDRYILEKYIRIKTQP